MHLEAPKISLPGGRVARAVGPGGPRDPCTPNPQGLARSPPPAAWAGAEPAARAVRPDRRSVGGLGAAAGSASGVTVGEKRGCLPGRPRATHASNLLFILSPPPPPSPLPHRVTSAPAGPPDSGPATSGLPTGTSSCLVHEWKGDGFSRDTELRACALSHFASFSLPVLMGSSPCIFVSCTEVLLL